MVKKIAVLGMKRLQIVLLLSLVFCFSCFSVGAELAELRVTFPQQVVSLDPHGPGAGERIVMVLSRHIFDALVDMGPDTEIYPGLAESWEVVDPLTWRFHLREGVHFHNGEPVNAEAVVWSFERLRSLGSPIAPLFAPVTAVVAEDTYTVKIVTQAPYAPLLKNLFFLKIVPPQASQEDEFATEPIGSGPFEFVSWEPRERVTLKANTQYWRKGVPAVDRLIFYDIPEPAAAVTALMRGEIDVAVGVPPEEIGVLTNAGFIVEQMPVTVQMKYLWMNCRGPLADPQVRAALWYAIDVPTLVDTVFEGLGNVPTSLIGSGVFGYAPMPQIPYDPAHAQRLLAAAGYPQGFTISLKYNVHDLRVQELADVIQAQLSAIGVTTVLVPQERAAWLEDFLPPKLDWDLTICNAGALTGDPDYSLNRLLYSPAQRTLCADPDLDYWLERARSTLDPSEREEVIRRVIQMLWGGGGPWLPLLEQKMSTAWAPGVRGFVPAANELVDFTGVSVSK